MATLNLSYIAALAMAFIGADCNGLSSQASSDGGVIHAGATVCNDVAAEFSPSGRNPNGPWSYGWSADAFHSMFILYTEFGSGLAGLSDSADLAAWTPAGVSYPAAWLNTADMVRHPGGTTTVQPHQFVLHPGPSGEFSVARWTSPASGNIHVQALFAGAAGYGASDVTTTVLHIQHNGLEIAAGILNLDDGGNSFAWESIVDVAAHDTVDFLVGDGNDSYAPDSTVLNAIICY